jgi:hypothetical protein
MLLLDIDHEEYCGRFYIQSIFDIENNTTSALEDHRHARSRADLYKNIYI